MSDRPADPITDDHRRAVRMLEFCLTLGHTDTDTWLGAIAVFGIRLSPRELAALSYVCLRALDPEDASRVTEAVLGRSDTPLPPFMSAMEDASYWADWASPNYVKAVVLAGYNRLPARDQVGFLDSVNGRTAA